MATMRGRKRTDDPTPNRARDIQRAFRARRAAHLESLEQRIRDLEDENIYFRKMLSLPPANRPPLGKGPTGRGVAKSRSRLNNDGVDMQCGSPEPSDSSSTPPIDYALTLPATAMEVYPPTLPGSADGMPTNARSLNDIKLMNDMSSPEMYTDNMMSAPIHHYQDAEGNGSILPFGYHEESAWPINPDVPLPAEITPTMETARYFVYAPSEQPHAPQPIVPQSVHERPINFGHRRSNTEPQSFGSTLHPFSPSHRNSNSQTFLPIPGHELTPSPPPLAIRSTVQGFR